MIMDFPERTGDVKTLLTAEVPEGGKEGKSKLEVSNPCLKQRRKWFCREERLGNDGTIEYLGIEKGTSLRKLRNKEGKSGTMWKRR